MKKTNIFLILLAILGLMIFGCAEKQDPLSAGSGTHPEGWMDKSDENFHGAAVILSVNKSSSCKTCHGEDYTGGTSEVSCYKCHVGYPHGDDFVHTAKMPDIFWNIRASCATCHGADYKGGETYGIPDSLSSKNCTRCHQQAEGPETCNTCHGSSENFAPPKDRLGNMDISEITVGVHQKHLTDTSVTIVAMNEDCMACHPDVTAFDTPTHLDDTVNDPADIQFSALASAHGATPVWNRDNLTCDNLYCHGGFTFYRDSSDNQFAYADSVIIGVGTTPLWTDTPSDNETDDCSLCHGQPPIGHGTFGNSCSCHSNWSGGSISDKTTHMDGLITYP